MASKSNFSTTYPHKHLTSNWKYLPRLQSHVVGKCRQPETKPKIIFVRTGMHMSEK
jgi:hypothetical protein